MTYTVETPRSKKRRLRWPKLPLAERQLAWTGRALLLLLPVLAFVLVEYLNYNSWDDFTPVQIALNLAWYYLLELVEKYVKPVWQPGDLLSSSEKIIGLCQKRVVYKKDMKVGWLARFLSRFASHSSAGIGVDSPYKMQFAINERGALFVIWAAICAGFGKLFGKRGVFYEMVGQEVSGLDGFYDHEFQEYGEFGIRIPENPGKVCDEIEAATGVQAMIVDANDLNVEILGKASSITLDDETLKGLIRDNPAGQSRELTPFILIREVKEEGETA